MNPICLSVAPNLRCISLLPAEYKALIVPSAIELFILLLLVFLKRRDGRRYLLLAADSLTYFILSVIDILSHTNPAVRNSLFLFKTADIVVGSLSFIPLLFYTSFLFVLSRKSFFIIVPKRAALYVRYFVIILMLALIASNEVASFVNISIRLSPHTGTHQSIPTPTTSPLHLFFSTLTLALYTATQITYFLLSFYRLVKALLTQQRITVEIERTRSHTSEHHFFNGIGFITVGVGFGALETLVAFYHGVDSHSTIALGVPLARRILRMLARACIVLGLLKGLDASENFQNITDELRRDIRHGSWFSIPNLHALMSTPHSSISIFRRPPLIPRTTSPSLDSANRGNRGNRVTVHLERDKAPFLQIRFSALSAVEFPSPAVLPQGRNRTQSEVICTSSPIGTGFEVLLGRRTSFDNVGVGTILDNRPFRFPGAATKHDSGATIPDSHIRSLEAQFPSLPPRVTGKCRGSILGTRYEEDAYVMPLSALVGDAERQPREFENARSGVTLTPSNSIKRKPAPPLLPIPTPPWLSRDHCGVNSAVRDSDAVAAVVDDPVSPSSFTTQTVDSPGYPPSPGALSTSSAYQRQSAYSVRSAEWLATPSHVRILTQGDVEAYLGKGRGDNAAADDHPLEAVTPAPWSGTTCQFSPRHRASPGGEPHDGRAVFMHQTRQSEFSVRSAEWLASASASAPVYEQPRAGITQAEIDNYRNSNTNKPDGGPIPTPSVLSPSHSAPSGLEPPRPSRANRPPRGPQLRQLSLHMGQAPIRTTPTPTSVAFEWTKSRVDSDRVVSLHGSVRNMESPFSSEIRDLSPGGAKSSFLL